MPQHLERRVDLKIIRPPFKESVLTGQEPAQDPLVQLGSPGGQVLVVEARWKRAQQREQQRDATHAGGGRVALELGTEPGCGGGREPRVNEPTGLL